MESPYYVSHLIDRYFAVRRASKPTRLFWNFLPSDTSIIFSAPSRPLDSGYRMCWSSGGDVQSLRDFYLFLHYRFPHRIRFRRQGPDREIPSFLNSEDDWLEHRFSNMVIIGGPVYNIKTQRTLLAIHRRLTPESQDNIYHAVAFWKGRSYTPDSLLPTYDERLLSLLRKSPSPHGYPDLAFTNRRESRSYEPTMGEGHELETDYGIAIKCSNPYRPDKQIVIVYGAYDLGTKAAMDYITSNEKLQELLRDVGSNSNLWVLVEAKVKKRKVVNIRGVDCGTLRFLSRQHWPNDVA